MMLEEAHDELAKWWRGLICRKGRRSENGGGDVLWVG